MDDYVPPHIQQTYAPGKKFLLVTGILLIIFGVSGLLNGIVFFILGDWIFEQVNESMEVLEEFGMDWSPYFSAVLEDSNIHILAIAQSAIMLAIGIMGVLWRQVIEKAQILFVGGIVCILSYLIPNFISFNILTFTASLVSLILPILFVVGASKNKAEMAE